MMRQLADEPDGVAEPEAVALPHVRLAGERVEGREQAILDEDVVAGEGPREPRLAGVGVADERAVRALAAPEPLVRAVVRHVLQALLQDRDLAADRAPVRLELGLARAPQPDAAADARQVRPHPGEPRQQVLELCELHLHLGFGRTGPGREDVENHLTAVHDPHRERLLQVDSLHGRERLVDEHERGAGVGQDPLQLLDLPLSEIEVGRGRFDPLGGPADHGRAGRVREARQLREMLLHLLRVGRPLARGADQKGALDGRLDVYELTGHLTSFRSGTLPLAFSATVSSPSGVSRITFPTSPYPTARFVKSARAPAPRPAHSKRVGTMTRLWLSGERSSGRSSRAVPKWVSSRSRSTSMRVERMRNALGLYTSNTRSSVPPPSERPVMSMRSSRMSGSLKDSLPSVAQALTATHSPTHTGRGTRDTGNVKPRRALTCPVSRFPFPELTAPSTSSRTPSALPRSSHTRSPLVRTTSRRGAPPAGSPAARRRPRRRARTCTRRRSPALPSAWWEHCGCGAAPGPRGARPRRPSPARTPRTRGSTWARWRDTPSPPPARALLPGSPGSGRRPSPPAPP